MNVMFTDDDLVIREATSKIDLIMRDRLDALIKASLADGQEDWQISEAFVIAAFRVLEGIEDERLRLLYAQHFERLARHLSRKMLEEVVSARMAEEAAAWEAASEPRKE
jgi:hypothetical protein